MSHSEDTESAEPDALLPIYQRPKDDNEVNTGNALNQEHDSVATDHSPPSGPMTDSV